MLIFQNLHLNLETVLQNHETWYNKRNEAKQELWLDADCILSYVAMNTSIFEHLHETYPGITILLHKNNVLLYCLHGHDDLDIVVNISMTMRILLDMTVRVFINGQSCRPMS